MFIPIMIAVVTILSLAFITFIAGTIYYGVKLEREANTPKPEVKSTVTHSKHWTLAQARGTENVLPQNMIIDRAKLKKPEDMKNYGD